MAEPPDDFNQALQALVRDLHRSIGAQAREASKQAALAWRARLIEAGKALQGQYEAAMPSNWRGFTEEEFDRALDFGAATGVSIVWVPRAAVVRRLLAASDVDVELVASTSLILDDLRRELELAVHPDLEHSPELAGQALDAFATGHTEAAQSHAAAALTGVIQLNLGEKKLNAARTKFQRHHPNDVGMRQMRLVALLQTAARALLTDGTAPPGFNRHKTVHGRWADQYTPANGLASLLLLVGVLRELAVWIGDDEPET